MLEVSIGIPAYNEEANIGRLLKTLLGQKLRQVKIREIIVVASGCIDKTVEIVKGFQKKEKRIKLFVQRQRLGKNAANNLFFKKAKSNTLVLVCADILLKKDCLENLIRPFLDPKVGIAAARMIPLNKKDNIPGYFSHLWWRLWHRVASKFFRAGELLAFRRVVRSIPKEIGADEVFLTDEIFAKGYKGRYVPRAIGYNMGPQTIGDIIRIRRRHACLHLEFRDSGPKAYYPKTMDNFYVFRLFLKEVNWNSPREAIFATLCLILEGASRILAYYDFYSGNKNYQAWLRSESTKKLPVFKNFK